MKTIETRVSELLKLDIPKLNRIQLDSALTKIGGEN